MLWPLALTIATAVALCSAQNSIKFPARIFATNGSCPTQEQQEEIRTEITSQVLGLLNIGLSPEYPISSCAALPAHRPPGFYWIESTTFPPSVQLYCDFNTQCGCDNDTMWTRVGFLNMSDPDQDCPSNWNLVTSEAPFRICGYGRGTVGEECLSHFYPTFGISFSRVCGRITSYTQGSTEAFHSLINRGRGLEENYIDGVSLTHGDAGSRQHIWSFVSANGEEGIFSPEWVCDCSNINQGWSFSTSFIGNDYFCDTGNHDQTFSGAFYPDDPLWDGEGCGSVSTCCEFNGPPWFCKPLPQTTSDDLEVRICRGERDPDSDTPVRLLELYVQ